MRMMHSLIRRSALVLAAVSLFAGCSDDPPAKKLDAAATGGAGTGGSVSATGGSAGGTGGAAGGTGGASSSDAGATADAARTDTGADTAAADAASADAAPADAAATADAAAVDAVATADAAAVDAASADAAVATDTAASTDVPASAAVQLKVSWWGSADRTSRTNQVLRMFEAKNPNIKVTAEFYVSTQGVAGTAYWPTLNAHATSQTLPDVMQHDYAYIEEWTNRGLLKELDGLVADGTLNLGDVAAGFVDGGKVKGKIMGISLGTNTQSIVLDTNAFKDANIALPGDDWTWADFERVALEIKAKLGIWGFGVGLHGYTPGWKAVYLSRGEWVFSADGKALGYTDDAPWIEHWKMILRLQAAGALPKRDQWSSGVGIEGTPLAFGKSAMEFAHSNQLVALWTAAGTARTLKALPVPKVVGGRSPVYIKPSQYFSVTATSKYPKEAAMLIDFFTNDVEANKILGGERGVPVAGKVLAALRPTLSKQAAESFDLIERASKYATKLPPNDPPAWTTILTQIFTPKVEDPITYGVRTPEEAVAQFRAEATQVLATGLVPDSGAPSLDGPTVDASIDAAAPADAAPADGGVD
jgi:multiple sugar transport system substrate-binding protein